MAFDFNNRPSNSGGNSAFDNGPSVPKRSQESRGGFHIPERDTSKRNSNIGRMESAGDQIGRELQNARSKALDRWGNQRRSVSKVDIPWTAIIYVLIVVVVVALLVVFWDVIYALMVNILSFLLLMIIFLAILRFLLRR